MVVLSNRGAKLLSRQNEGDVLVGGKCFHTALHILKRHLKRRQISEICPMSPPTRNTEGVCASLEITTPPLIRQQCDERRGRTRGGEAQRSLKSSPQTKRSTHLLSRLGLSRYYLYTRPFKLSRSMLLAKDLLLKSSLVTAIMTFNLALSHHLMGYTNAPQEKGKSWCAALQLYGIAKSLHQKVATMTTKQTQDERPRRALGIMLDLAIDNNTAVLHSELGDKHRSLSYFRSLTGRVQQLGVQHQRHAALQGFVSNIILLGTISDNAATAA